MIKGIIIVLIVAVLLGWSCVFISDEDNDDFNPDEF